MASANLQILAEFARSLELNALSLSHLTFITTTIRTFHILWIALLSRVCQEYFLLTPKSTVGIVMLHTARRKRRRRTRILRNLKLCAAASANGTGRKASEICCLQLPAGTARNSQRPAIVNSSECPFNTQLK